MHMWCLASRGGLRVPSDPRSKVAPEFLLGRSQERELYSGHLFAHCKGDLLSWEGIWSL